MPLRLRRLFARRAGSTGTRGPTPSVSASSQGSNVPNLIKKPLSCVPDSAKAESEPDTSELAPVSRHDVVSGPVPVPIPAQTSASETKSREEPPVADDVQLQQPDNNDAPAPLRRPPETQTEAPQLPTAGHQEPPIATSPEEPEPREKLSPGDSSQSSRDDSSQTLRRRSVSHGDETSKLWELAYGSLRNNHPEMIARYEEIVNHLGLLDDEHAMAPGLEPGSTTEDDSGPQEQDRSSARAHQLLEAWLDRQEQQLEESQRGDLWRVFVELARLVSRKSSHAAVSLIAGCVGAETISDRPPATSQTARSNISLLLSRTPWYCTLPKLIAVEHGRRSPSTGAMQEHAEELKRCLVELYSTILGYQIGIATSGAESPDHSEFADDDDFPSKLLGKEKTITTAFVGQNVEAYMAQLADLAHLDSSLTADEGEDANASGDDALSSGASDESDLSDLRARTIGKPSSGHGESDSGANPAHSQEPAHLSGDEVSLHDDLYQWLLGTSQYAKFQEWHPDEEEHRILWISGSPGSGKTMALTAIARRLLAWDKPPSDKRKRICAYFCNNRTEHLDNPSSVIWGIVSKLLEEQQELKEYLDRKLKAIKRDDLCNPEDFAAIAEVLYSMIRDEKFEATYLVVDGFDECFPDVEGDQAAGGRALESVLKLISVTTSLPSKVRWLISLDSSRVSAKLIGRALHLKVDSASNAMQSAARTHIASLVTELTKDTSWSPTYREKFEADLLHRSRGNFLWADLACQIIKHNESPWNARRVLAEELPGNVEPLYEYAMDRISKLAWDDGKLCEMVIRAATVAFRPLQVWELKNLLCLEDEVDLKILIRKLCFTFLAVRDDTACFAHQSARRFQYSVMDKKRITSSGHCILARGCVEYLTRSFCDQQADLPGNPYATTFWINHLSKAERFQSLDSETITSVIKFVQEKGFFHWLEFLSTKQSPSQAQSQIASLENTLKRLTHPLMEQSAADGSGTNSTTCIELIRDAGRLLRFHEAAKTAANSKLMNSLLFSPSNSPIRQKYVNDHFLELLSPPLVAGSHLNRSAELFNLRSHEDWARGCAYSPDGRLIASCSDDETVRIWNAHTGKLQNVIYGCDGWLLQVAFSSKGVLAARTAGFIYLWDSTTHLPQKRLDGSELKDVPFGSFNSFAFSPCGGMLTATLSDDDDNERYTATYNLPSFEAKCWAVGGDGASPGNIAYSPDGSLLAFINYGQLSVNLRKANDGQLVRCIKTGEYPRCVAFSPDSRFLAIGRDSEDVALCDLTRSGEAELPSSELTVLDGHRGIVRAVAFSPDASRFASVDNGGEIRLWKRNDDATYEPLKVIKEHPRAVLSVAFSPKSGYLASSFKDGSVRVWDVGADEDIDAVAGEGADANKKPDQNHHSAPITCVVLSPDGRLIASGCADGRINIWDGDTGSHLRPLLGENGSTTPHNAQILWLAFSRDSNSLASTATEPSLIVWDTHTGARKHKRLFTANLHRDWIRYALFSKDGKRLASASDDRTVRLWDISAGEGDEADPPPPKILDGHTDYVFCLAFSPDAEERYLASAGDDSKIMIWDLSLVDDEDNPERSKILGPTSPCRAVCFFPKGNRIISSIIRGALEIWDRASGERLYVLDRDETFFTSLSFASPATSSRDALDFVLTERGARNILEWDSDAAPSSWASAPSWWPYGFGSEGKYGQQWITRGGKKAIFLPETHQCDRDAQCATSVRGRKVVVGCGSGAVVLFRFKEDAGVNPGGGISRRSTSTGMTL